MTSYGSKGESGEREPKGATSSDTRGERHTGTPKADREHGAEGDSGEHAPGSKASDSSGERHAKIVGGVGMGKADSIGAREASHMGKHDGRTGEFNTGKTSATVYSRKRSAY